MLFSVVGLLFSVTETKGVLIGSVAIFASIAVLIYKTEKAIKQKFGN